MAAADAREEKRITALEMGGAITGMETDDGISGSGADELLRHKNAKYDNPSYLSIFPPSCNLDAMKADQYMRPVNEVMAIFNPNFDIDVVNVDTPENSFIRNSLNRKQVAGKCRHDGANEDSLVLTVRSILYQQTVCRIVEDGEAVRARPRQEVSI